MHIQRHGAPKNEPKAHPPLTGLRTNMPKAQHTPRRLDVQEGGGRTQIATQLL